MQDVLPELVSVSELNRLARGLLERGLPPLWVSGEISNLTVAASGHAYFSLKDKGGQIRAVMFRGRVAGLPFRLREGVQVEAFGQVSLYEARGDYQIQLDRMREAGLGRLFEAFERLKRQLGEEGLFDPARKRPLPAFPRRIGIVSSPSGAALRDVVSTLRRRMPSAPLVLYPTLVQGEAAPAQIVAAITQAALRQEVDVLMVCRGGGSIEDLWAFNDETVARALAACPIPTISGVGHETDFTIADFVADLRAPTPTGAAEQVCPNRQALLAELAQREQRLRRAMQRLLHSRMQALDACPPGSPTPASACASKRNCSSAIKPGWPVWRAAPCSRPAGGWSGWPSVTLACARKPPPRKPAWTRWPSACVRLCAGNWRKPRCISSTWPTG